MPAVGLEPSTGILAGIKEDLDGLVVEPRLRLGMRDHYDNLLNLASNLQKLGLDDVVIDEQILSMFENYREKLLRHLSVHPVAEPVQDSDHG